MASVIIDTASWIQLAKPKYNNLLKELEKLVDEGRLEIIKNEIIDEEWNRNKDRTFRDIISSIKEYAKSAVKMKELLPDSEGQILEQIISKYQTLEEEQEALAEAHYYRVNKLIAEATTVAISENLKLRMVERALKKKAPFHNSRNNMADALIIFSAIDWVNEHKVFSDLYCSFLAIIRNLLIRAILSKYIHKYLKKQMMRTFISQMTLEGYYT